MDDNVRLGVERLPMGLWRNGAMSYAWARGAKMRY